MVEEMTKLRKMLTEHGIKWHDASTPKNYPLQIDRTHFDYKGYSWSVINGFGTFGGYDEFRNKGNEGLLELMSAAVNDGEPVGYLMADDVIKLVLGEENESEIISKLIDRELDKLKKLAAGEKIIGSI